MLYPAPTSLCLLPAYISAPLFTYYEFTVSVFSAGGLNSKDTRPERGFPELVSTVGGSEDRLSAGPLPGTYALLVHYSSSVPGSTYLNTILVLPNIRWTTTTDWSFLPSSYVNPTNKVEMELHHGCCTLRIHIHTSNRGIYILARAAIHCSSFDVHETM